MKNYVGKICPFCKTEIKEDEQIQECSACGIPHHKNCWDENKGCTTFGCSEQVHEVIEKISTENCSNCGANITSEHTFCPKCGQKSGVQNDAALTNKIQDFNNSAAKAKKKKTIKLVIIISVCALVAIGLYLMIRGTPVEEVLFSKSEITIYENESTDIIYTISPDDATDQSVTWSSSNESIATVEDGKLSAKSEGTCSITINATNGKSDTLIVIVEKALPNFNDLFSTEATSYNEIEEYIQISDDGTWMKYDSNPSNFDEWSVGAWSLGFIEIANEELGLPSSVYQKMLETRSLDGRQSDETDVIEVSWTYHPDNGLEVMYEVKN